MNKTVTAATHTGTFYHAALRSMTREQLRELAKDLCIPRGRDKDETISNLINACVTATVTISKKSVELRDVHAVDYDPNDQVAFAKEYEAVRELALRNGLYIPTVDEEGNKVWDDVNLVELYDDHNSDREFIEQITPVVKKHGWNVKYGKGKAL